MSICTIPIEDGPIVRLDVKQNPLGNRAWQWTEYRTTSFKGVPYQVPTAIWDCLPLGYPPELDGYVVLALPDGRFVARSKHELFPIMDERQALQSGEALLGKVMAIASDQPTLF